MINFTRFFRTNYDRGKIYREFMITWVIVENSLDYTLYTKKFEIFQTPIGIAWFGDIIISGKLL